MKSERAKQHIARNVFRVDNDTFLPLVITRDNCNKAVELAEQEAEERMREKAHKIIKEMMEGVFQGNMPQNIADEFIQKLTEE